MKHIITISLVMFIGLTLSNAQTRSFKRGLGYNNLLTEDVAALAPGMAWGYNWGHSGSGNDPAFSEYNIEFIPMAWNGLNKSTIRNLLSKHPEIKYILGFNEPNFKDQANLTPAQAVERWSDIEEIADEFGLTIVGPAVNYSPDAPYQDPLKWYDEFFSLCPECRVDHIAIHLYMSTASAIKSNIEKFKKYGKPIWLTEFCAWETGTTEKSQKKFLVEAFDYLETEPAVFRYAWFKERGWSDAHPYMQLLNRSKEGVLKDLGAVYTHMSSYDDNFYFSIDEEIPSEHYIRMKGINLEQTTDASGNINICEFDAPADWVDYNIDIPESGEYNVFFRLSAEYPDESIIKISVNDQEIGEMTIEKKGVDVWDTQSFKAQFVAGKQKVRVAFKKGGVRLNWWAISKDENLFASTESVINNNLRIYPNPVKNILQIDLPIGNSTITLYDIAGKKVLSLINTDKVDMSNFSAGVYFLELEGENGFKNLNKIIKED